jgi:hypothetical protein
MRASDINAMWLGVRPEDAQPSSGLAEKVPGKIKYLPVNTETITTRVYALWYS